MKKPNLCHECKRKRILSGMANAKAKGKRIGRLKKRNSVLIRSLIEAKLSYREIARISKCSHGSVHAEIVAYRKEKEAEEKQKLLEFQNTLNSESTSSTIEALKNANVPADSIKNYQQKIENDAKIKVTEIQGTYYETFD